VDVDLGRLADHVTLIAPTRVSLIAPTRVSLLAPTCVRLLAPTRRSLLAPTRGSAQENQTIVAMPSAMSTI
jgi:hypothetical protein